MLMVRLFQGFRPLISRMRAKARRTCGHVIEPPTIRATLSVDDFLALPAFFAAADK